MELVLETLEVLLLGYLVVKPLLVKPVPVPVEEPIGPVAPSVRVRSGRKHLRVHKMERAERRARRSL